MTVNYASLMTEEDISNLEFFFREWLEETLHQSEVPSAMEPHADWRIDTTQTLEEAGFMTDDNGLLVTLANGKRVILTIKEMPVG